MFYLIIVSILKLNRSIKKMHCYCNDTVNGTVKNNNISNISYKILKMLITVFIKKKKKKNFIVQNKLQY